MKCRLASRGCCNTHHPFEESVRASGAAGPAFTPMTYVDPSKPPLPPPPGYGGRRKPQRFDYEMWERMPPESQLQALNRLSDKDLQKAMQYADIEFQEYPAKVAEDLSDGVRKELKRRGSILKPQPKNYVPYDE